MRRNQKLLLLLKKGRVEPVAPGAGAGGASSAEITMPATQAASYDALEPTWDRINDKAVYTTVATIIPTSASSTPTFSLVGDEATGFTVSESGGNAVVKLVNRRQVLDNGIRQQLANLDERVFTVRATVGALTDDTVLTLTLDTSSYDVPSAGGVPGIDVAVGRRSANALNVVSAANVPAGWTRDTNGAVGGVGGRIFPSANDATLTDWDTASYLVLINKTGVTITDCLIRPGVRLPGATSAPLLTVPAGGSVTVNSTTIDLDGGGSQAGWNGAANSGAGVLVMNDCAILGAQNDGIVCSNATIDNIYISTSKLNKYTTGDGSTRITNTSNWGHSDGVQSYDLTGPVTVQNFLICNDIDWHEPGVTPTQLTGTATFVNATGDVTGSGTNWLTSLAVGDIIRQGNDANPKMSAGVANGMSFYVSAVTSDTEITVSPAVPSAGYAGECGLRKISFEDAAAGTTSPLYAQGTDAIDLVHDLKFLDGIAMGGGYVFQTHLASEEGVKARGLIYWKNIAIGDYAYPPDAASRPQSVSTVDVTAAIEDCYDVFSNVAVTDVRPTVGDIIVYRAGLEPAGYYAG